MNFIIAILLLSATTLIGQTRRFDFIVHADLFSIPTSDFTSDIPNPKYEVRSNARVNEAVNFNITWWTLKNFGVTCGIGFHSFNYDTHFRIPSQFSDSDFFHESKVINLVCWGPVFGIAYKADRVKFSLGVNHYEPLERNISHKSRSYTSYIFSPEFPDDPAIIRIEEEFLPKGFGYRYTLWNLAIQYKIIHGLKFHLGFETSFDPPYHNYRLHIYEYLVDKLETVNDFKLLNKYSAVTIGMSYAIPFGRVVE